MNEGLRNLWRAGAAWLPVDSKLRRVDFSRVRTLHFICKGNVCRSAYAAARARSWGLPVSSSGVEAGTDKPADDAATRVAAARGVALDVHFTTRFSDVELGPHDLVVAMEPWQAHAARPAVDDVGAQLTLLGLWSSSPRNVVPDPYGLVDSQFEKCFDLIDSSVQGLYSAMVQVGSVRRHGHVEAVGRVEPGTAVRPPAGHWWRSSRLRYRLKVLVGSVLFASGGYKRLVRNRAIIFVFHSVVPDGPGDSLRIPVDHFRRYLDFIGRHFRVVSLPDLADSVKHGRDIGGLAAITFDDGYWDNLHLAEPELRRRGLTATFFVTTGFIGTDTQAPWDTRKGWQSKWMNWDEVRQLKALGHEVGGHTVSHADLAILDEKGIRSEVSGSIDTLCAELGDRPGTFAVPFGSPVSVSETLLAELGRNGIHACVTAVGGSVAPDSQPLQLNRFPVNHVEAGSPYAAGIDIINDCRTVDRRRIVRPAS